MVQKRETKAINKLCVREILSLSFVCGAYFFEFRGRNLVCFGIAYNFDGGGTGKFAPEAGKARMRTAFFTRVACTSTQTSELNPVNSDHVSPSSPEVESRKFRPLTIDFDHVSPSSPEAKSSNVCPLTSEEKTLIKTIFIDIIVKDQVVCVRDIRPLLMADTKLRTLVPHKTMVQRVADHICYCQVKHPRKDPNELPQADAESNISEWLEA